MTLEITAWGAEGMAGEGEGSQSGGAVGGTCLPWLLPTLPKRLPLNPFSSAPTREMFLEYNSHPVAHVFKPFSLDSNLLGVCY